MIEGEIRAADMAAQQALWMLLESNEQAPPDALYSLRNLIALGARPSELRQVFGWLRHAPIHMLVRKNRPSWVDVFHQAGVALDTLDGKGNTPASLAAYNGNKDFLCELQRCGVDMFAAIDTEGTTLLHHAASHRHRTEVVEQLLLWGIPVNQKDDFGRTAAYVGYENPTMIRTLAQAGANFNLQDKDGDTVAHLVMRSADGGLEPLMALLRWDVDLKIANLAGETPEDLARKVPATQDLLLRWLAAKEARLALMSIEASCSVGDDAPKMDRP